MIPKTRHLEKACNWTCHTSGSIAKIRNKCHTDQNPCNQFRNPCHHRQEAVTHTLQTVPQDKQQTQCRIEIRIQPQVFFYLCHDFCFRGIQKQQCHPSAQYNDNYGRYHTINHGNNHTCPNTAPNPFKFPCTPILSAVGCHGDAQAFHRACQNHLQLRSSCYSGNGNRSQSVYSCLQDNRTNCSNGKLQRHRQTNGNQPSAARKR